MRIERIMKMYDSFPPNVAI